jgi:hypothetical protein
MSWDVRMLNFGKDRPASVEEMGEPKSLGSAKQVRERISKALPDVEWSDHESGVYSAGDDLSLEFSIDGTSKVEGVMVSARGSGDAVGALLRVATPNGWSLLDLSTSELIDPENPSSDGWEGFQNLVRRGSSRKRGGSKKKGRR